MARRNTPRIKSKAFFNRPVLVMFLALFIVVGTIAVYYSFAAGIPSVNTNADYWRPRIAKCESGGSYGAINNAGYYGAYQFDVGTWNGYGGYMRPDQAPPAIQDAKFNETFARRGSQPWNSSYFCWSRGTAIVTPPPPPLFVPKLTTYNVTVTGQVVVNGAPVPNVKINTCGNTGDDFKTDAGGNFAFVIASGKDFCVRATEGLPAGSTLTSTNNNFENRNATTYEYQVAGQNDFHNLWALFSPSYRWDRGVDSGYVLNYKTP